MPASPSGAPAPPSPYPHSLCFSVKKPQKADWDSTAGNASVPTALYDPGPSRHARPGTREQLLDETLWQLSSSGRGRRRWESTAGNARATSGTTARIAFPRRLLLSADPVNPAQIYGY